MNAAPFSARLLTNTPLPPWHKATPQVREVAKKAAEHCAAKGSDIAKLALQFSIRHPDMATCIVGSANPQNVQKWAQWAAEPVDEQLLKEVQQILAPIHNWVYREGKPENND
jgi:aryl-alcohol dehydrogenase-like predicted oxidoreductase